MSPDLSNRSDRPIPTPLRVRLSRFASTFVPPVVFLACVATSSWMWARHTAVSSIMGRVETTSVEIAAASSVGGRLTAARRESVALFADVHAGQLLFRIDDRPTLAELAVVQAELARHRAALQAESRALVRGQIAEERSQDVTIQRLAVEVAERRLDTLDRQAALAADRIDLQRLDFDVARLEAMVDAAAETDYALRTAQLRRDSLATRVDRDQVALALSESEAQAARDRLAALPPAVGLDDDDLAILLGPIDGDIEVVGRRLDAIQVAIESLEIRATMAGTITAVYRNDGEVALPGEPILTITDPYATHVLAYLPETGPMQIAVDRRVSIRPFGGAVANRTQFESRVLAVGARIDRIPIEYTRNPTAVDRAEWGLPVRMELPAGSELRPGQRVEVRLLRQ